MTIVIQYFPTEYCYVLLARYTVCVWVLERERERLTPRGEKERSESALHTQNLCRQSSNRQNLKSCRQDESRLTYNSRDKPLIPSKTIYVKQMHTEDFTAKWPTKQPSSHEIINSADSSCVDPRNQLVYTSSSQNKLPKHHSTLFFFKRYTLALRAGTQPE